MRQGSLSEALGWSGVQTLDQPLRESEFPELLTMSATAKPSLEAESAKEEGTSFEGLSHPQNPGKSADPVA